MKIALWPLILVLALFAVPAVPAVPADLKLGEFAVYSGTRTWLANQLVHVHGRYANGGLWLCPEERTAEPCAYVRPGVNGAVVTAVPPPLAVPWNRGGSLLCWETAEAPAIARMKVKPLIAGRWMRCKIRGRTP